MNVIRLTVALIGLALLAACDPSQTTTGSAPAGAAQADYERHKANRQAYLYQGI